MRGMWYVLQLPIIVCSSAFKLHFSITSVHLKCYPRTAGLDNPQRFGGATMKNTPTPCISTHLQSLPVRRRNMRPLRNTCFYCSNDWILTPPAATLSFISFQSVFEKGNLQGKQQFSHTFAACISFYANHLIYFKSSSPLCAMLHS